MLMFQKDWFDCWKAPLMDIHPASVVSRRQFLQTTGGIAAGWTMCGLPCPEIHAAEETPKFSISLAQWSLHKMLFSKKLDNLDFARISKREFGIDAVEYVNQFFKDKAGNAKYISEMKKRAAGEGVKSLLIMIDGEGRLGDPNAAKRTQAVNNHHKWVAAAKELGCFAIRVNAGSAGSYEEQQKLAADGLSRLTEFATTHEISVIVENHGGLSSNGKWLASVIKMVNKPACGTLPDFGNFNLGGGKQYDRYQGVRELMPFAKAVSAKSHDFDDRGNEVNTDYFKMMKIVLDAGYRGYVGVEYEGRKMSEVQGIMATRKLLERVREQA